MNKHLFNLAFFTGAAAVTWVGFGFIDSSAKSAMKMEVESRDTPFSVTSYSESFMAEMASANVADMYKYMTGIQKAGNTAYDMNIRGF